MHLQSWAVIHLQMYFFPLLSLDLKLKNEHIKNKVARK